MRTVLAVVVAVLLAGCSGTRTAQRTAPVVSEPPSLSERLRVNQQREAERATLNDTVVKGGVARQ